MIVDPWMALIEDTCYSSYTITLDGYRHAGIDIIEFAVRELEEKFRAAGALGKPEFVIVVEAKARRH